MLCLCFISPLDQMFREAVSSLCALTRGLVVSGELVGVFEM